jgi:hypothetical protein
MYADLPGGPPAAHGFLPAADQGQDRRSPRMPTVSAAQTALLGSSSDLRETARSGPHIAHGTQPTVRVTAPFSRQKPVTPSGVTGFDLRKWVAGVGFEPT